MWEGSDGSAKTFRKVASVKSNIHVGAKMQVFPSKRYIAIKRALPTIPFNTAESPNVSVNKKLWDW